MTWTKDEIKKLREEYKWTQEQLAEHLRVHAESVRRWEQGRAKPPGPVTVLFDFLCLFMRKPEDC